jgi:nucleoside-diphosphate-sugar epimerase
MRALVTGATGFVGGHLVEALLRRGVEVTVLLRSPGKAGLLPPGVRRIPGDLHDARALDQAVEGQNQIYHVAGLVAAKDDAEFLRGNRDGTANLIKAAERSNVGRASLPRFVLVSSMAAGGPAQAGRPLRGDEPPAPVTVYGRSKLAGEEAVRASSLPWSILRPPMVYGPRDTEVLKVFRLARLGIVPVFGEGTQELSAVYAPDLAEALIAVSTSPRTVGRTYPVCHPEIFTSRAFVQAVGRAVNPGRQEPVRVVPLPRWLAVGALTLTGTVARLARQATILTTDKANEFFQPAWTGDPSALTEDTDWRPAHTLEAGLELTTTWYREQGWL